VDEQRPEKLCGRTLSTADLEVIRAQIRLAEPANRAEIARRVCRALDWSNALGEPKLMSARVGLLRLHRAGLIELPAPRCGNGNGRGLKYPPARWPEAIALHGRVDALSQVRLAAVRDKAASRLWNGLIDRYHDLGYSPLPGAQMRYLIESDQGLLGALGFGAAAWKVAARDAWIGWDQAQREAHLGRVVNNARFLLLPWIRVRHLASKVLGLAARRVGDDFAERYGERPVLLESFVELARYRATSYKAANWHYLGETQGRGKCDVAHRAALPRKGVYVYPLRADFRRALGVAA
jgi:hypothetical protein